MGFLGDKLYWSQKKADGTPRSMMAKILDPVGACIEPTDLSPFSEEDTVAAPTVSEPIDDPDQTTKSTVEATKEVS